ncbi:ZIP family metal transporter [Candidatus Woesearchaeota archaeon]|nr:ZIP family metal transporter [Candidatus Woesearchaeota archaeon]
MLLWIIGSVFLVSLISFIGILTLFFKMRFLKKLIPFLVSFAAGALIGAVFFDILPEALETSYFSNETILNLVVFGVVLFFLIERLCYLLHFHHYHHRHTHKKEIRRIKPFAYLNLMGDGIHNFIDGMIIAVGFLADFKLGLITSLAVVFHEIPQEIGDFGVLVYGGFTRKKAVLYNFYSALTAMMGAVLTFFFTTNITGLTQMLLPIAAGNFIYLALADLLPELHDEFSLTRNMWHVLIFILGLLVMLGITRLLHF